MPHKNLNTSVTIPLLLIIVATLLQYLLPPIESVEKTLTSCLRYKLLVPVLKSLVLSLAFLLPYYFYQSLEKPLKRKEREELLKTIENMVNAQYALHRSNILDGKFREALNREASRGFDLPTGTLAGAISDLYVRDIGFFSKILEDAISKATSGINTKTLHQYLTVLIRDMLTQHNSDIKELYNRFAKGYYDNMGTEHLNLMKTSFASLADAETKQRIKHLLSVNNLDKIHTTSR